MGFCPTKVAHITKERTARQITIERFEKMCIEHISYSTYVFSPDHIIKGQVIFWEYVWALKSDFYLVSFCHFGSVLRWWKKLAKESVDNVWKIICFVICCHLTPLRAELPSYCGRALKISNNYMVSILIGWSEDANKLKK